MENSLLDQYIAIRLDGVNRVDAVEVICDAMVTISNDAKIDVSLNVTMHREN